MSTREYVGGTFEKVLETARTIDTPEANRIVSLLAGDMPPATGTMKAWCQSHDNAKVLTVQKDNFRGTFWIPLPRIIDATKRAGAVFFDDSARDYSGMTVLSSSEEMLIVSDEWHTIAYLTFN
jgi:hypothetical protein